MDPIILSLWIIVWIMPNVRNILMICSKYVNIFFTGDSKYLHTEVNSLELNCLHGNENPYCKRLTCLYAKKDKCVAIRNLQTPKCPWIAPNILGHFNFLATFFQGFAKLLVPICVLARKHSNELSYVIKL